jgi:hypothetical protein
MSPAPVPPAAEPGPVIVCVAITGSLPTKADNPAVPITIAEQVESTQEAWEAAPASPTAMCATTRGGRRRTPSGSRGSSRGCGRIARG